jgi:NUMOD1 domain
MSKNVLVYSFDLETKDMVLYKSFNTCIEAAKYFDCSTRNLSRYLDKNKLYKKQWILLSSLVKDNSKE